MSVIDRVQNASDVEVGRLVVQEAGRIRGAKQRCKDSAGFGKLSGVFRSCIDPLFTLLF